MQMVKGALIQALSVTEGGKALISVFLFETVWSSKGASKHYTNGYWSNKERIELTLKWKFKCDN